MYIKSIDEMMTFLRKSKFPMINIVIIITITNQNCFLLWSDVFIFGTIHLGQGISILINWFHQLILYALVCRAFLVTKLGSPPVKNGSPGRRPNVIFNPWLSALGPYFSVYHNNDTAVTKHLFKDNLENINQELQANDMCIVDRGFWDAV
jgi:hypothetical protein